MEPKFYKYKNYTIADFAGDDDFIYAAKYAAANTGFVPGLTAAYPEKAADIVKAREFVIALSNQVVNDSTDNRENIWKNIVATANVQKQKTLLVRLYAYRNIAAIIVLLLLFAALYANYLYEHSQKTITTNFAATQSINLPDESVVLLNRNSTLSYSRLWNLNRSREVTLNGEASFNIKHVAVNNKITAADSFRVNVDGLRTTVLGTQFNIRSRHHQTTISLVRGKLRIDFIKIKHQPVILHPGEQFIYAPASSVAFTNKVNTAIVTAWTHQSIEMDGTTVADIFKLLEDDYGFKVKVKDPSILTRKLSGNVPMTDIKDMVFVLSTILNVSIEQDGKTLIVSAAK